MQRLHKEIAGTDYSRQPADLLQFCRNHEKHGAVIYKFKLIFQKSLSISFCKVKNTILMLLCYTGKAFIVEILFNNSLLD